MYSICFLYCVLGEETVNVHVRVSDTTQNDNPTISPSQRTETTDVSIVYNTTTTIENLPMEETGINTIVNINVAR